MNLLDNVYMMMEKICCLMMKFLEVKRFGLRVSRLVYESMKIIFIYIVFYVMKV